ncbi:TPA: hypothetical protein QDA98_006613, partial [Burkholderia vietnamiensis]|nr:hypothetical protein [Burkholderia vietnamiensis]
MTSPIEDAEFIPVNERDYQIGETGTPLAVLKTGWLFSCLAFYGRDHAKGVSFLCHLDWGNLGMDPMIDELKKSERLKDPNTNIADLSGFELYVTSGLNWLTRVICVLVLVV